MNEVNEYTHQCEEHIKEILINFQKETGLQVIGVDILNSCEISAKPKPARIFKVTINAMIPKGY